MNYHIRYYGDPVLRTKSKRVESIDEDFGLFAEQLVEMMYEYDGVGLAAPQVGVSKRVFAV
ncbi:MAG: peptide deformylase, partial [Thermotogota bacterium]|nr:peptide deformylase [Thermotogota bacterium]